MLKVEHVNSNEKIKRQHDKQYNIQKITGTVFESLTIRVNEQEMAYKHIAAHVYC
jgi:hypothetical protein